MPIDILYDDNSNFVGHIVPKMKNNGDSESLNSIIYGYVEYIFMENFMQNIGGHENGRIKTNII